MKNPPIVNISGYRFIPLVAPASLQAMLKESLPSTGVKGTVLLAKEGVNVTLAGTRKQTDAAIGCLNAHEPLKDIWLKESISNFVPHRRLRIRVRAEIIAFNSDLPIAHAKSPHTQFAPAQSAPTISAQTLDTWLDEKRPVTLLDARNDYEIESGTFATATHLAIKHFRHFKDAINGALEAGELDKETPVVTFCTGGIRCEKAAPWLTAQGFKEVYQIEGGVINYLQTSDASHWQGECFVFDDRVELNRELQPTGARLCDLCQLAVPQGSQCECQLGVHYHATYQIPE